MSESGTDGCASCKLAKPSRIFTVFQKDVVDKEHLGSPLPGQTQYKLTWKTTALNIPICAECLSTYKRNRVTRLAIPIVLFLLAFFGLLFADQYRGLSVVGILVFGFWTITQAVVFKHPLGVLLAARTARRAQNAVPGAKGTRIFCVSDSQYDHEEAPY